MNRNPFFERMRRSASLKALDRPELRRPSTERVPAAGTTSAAMKTVDAATRALIDEALDTIGKGYTRPPKSWGRPN